MATKTQREPIVTDKVEEKDNADSSVEEVTEPVLIEPPKKSSRLVNIKEFLHGTNLRLEEIAGFKAFVKDTKYLSSEEWNQKMSEFKTRTVK